MIVRSLTGTGDWTFGSGRNNYKSGNSAVAQSIQTRIMSFLGDCFFATEEGIDWFNLLGGKNQSSLNLAIAKTIRNTPEVTRITQLSVTLNAERVFRVEYNAYTATGLVTDNRTFNPVDYLITEDKDKIVTEDGEGITIT